MGVSRSQLLSQIGLYEDLLFEMTGAEIDRPDMSSREILRSRRESWWRQQKLGTYSRLHYATLRRLIDYYVRTPRYGEFRMEIESRRSDILLCASIFHGADEVHHFTESQNSDSILILKVSCTESAKADESLALCEALRKLTFVEVGEDRTEWMFLSPLDFQNGLPNFPSFITHICDELSKGRRVFKYPKSWYSPSAEGLKSVWSTWRSTGAAVGAPSDLKERRLDT